VPVPPARRAAIRRRLLAWYDAGHRALPWRFPQHGADPYRVWLAEVMLQQTQVAAAIPYYRRFVARWPSLASLAEAEDAEVLAAWSGLGYYARCRNLLSAAREALRRHGGLPAAPEALRALPGFGPYTAGAVASIAFAAPVPAVDGNAARVLARLFLVKGDPASPPVRRRIGALAAALVPDRRPGDFNQALMELGATVCRSPAPGCLRCPLRASCAARRAGRERQVPPPRRRPGRARLFLACAALERGGDLLLVRRPARGLFGGLWAPPAGEAASEAEARAALRRSLRELAGESARVGAELARVERTLTHRQLTLVAHRCRLGGKPRGEVRWVGRAELSRAGLPTAMRRLLEALPPGPGPVRAPTGGIQGGGPGGGSEKPLTSRVPSI
jgi:A/G-specific adenine glycosylase